MTAIAWDGTTLAADACEAFSNIQLPMDGSKIAIVDGHAGKFMFAGAGDSAFVHLVQDWLNAPVRAQFPDCAPYDLALGGTCVLLVDRNGDAHDVFNNGIIRPCTQRKRAAQGCAHDFLYGALFAGATAHQAVTLATQYVRSCGYRVDTMTLQDAFPEMYPADYKMAQTHLYEAMREDQWHAHKAQQQAGNQPVPWGPHNSPGPVPGQFMSGSPVRFTYWDEVSPNNGADDINMCAMKRHAFERQQNFNPPSKDGITIDIETDAVKSEVKKYED